MTDTEFRGTFSTAQTKQLLAPIRDERVLQDGKGNSHVAAHDVIAHLIRVFGFGNFSYEIISVEQVFETLRPLSMEGTVKVSGIDKSRSDCPWTWRYDVAYRATMRLTVFDEHHGYVTHYEDGSMGEAQNLVRQDAHDLAMKSAISLAKKRCATHLGDQFGLSLYNKGQRTALVRGTHVMTKDMWDELKSEKSEEHHDVQEGVPQQVSMGHDEIERSAEPTAEQEQVLRDSLGAEKVEQAEPSEEDLAAVAAAEEAGQ